MSIDAAAWIPRSGRDEAAGCVWLPRVIEKARRAIAGERAGREMLWPFMFGESDTLDGELLTFLELRNEDVLAVLRLQVDDTAAASEIVRRSGRTPDECAAFSAKFRKKYALALDLFDADEGRMRPGFKRWFFTFFYNKIFMPVVGVPKYRRAERRRIAQAGTAAANGDLGTQMRKNADVYAGLRSRALRTSPEDLGLRLEEGETVPYGSLMETGYPEAVATLVCFSSGDASLYTSTGGGVIGGIEHEAVRRAAQAFVASAKSFLSKMRKVSDFPEPPAGVTRFYVLTSHGIYASEALEDDLGRGNNELSPLFYAGQNVITQLRIVSEKKSDVR